MKSSFFLLAFALPLLASQSIHDGYLLSMRVDRYRKLGERYCDLQSLFTWINYEPARRDRTPNPMPEWQPMQVKVSQVISDGLLVRRWIPGFDLGQPLLLRNHPAQSSVVDGKYLSFLAVKLPDRFQYKDVLGSVQTVEQWDYGIPFDPQQRAREVARQKQ